MISNIHFEKTRDGSWVLEGRSIQVVGGIPLSHKIWNSTLGCAQVSVLKTKTILVSHD